GKDLSVLACVIPRSKPQPSSPLFPLFPLPSCFSSGPSLTFSISVSPMERDVGDVRVGVRTRFYPGFSPLRCYRVIWNSKLRSTGVRSIKQR
ncbi:hypothetical protein U1Q18_046246, partial [Sarracenia purpurea var. burkii]